MKVKKQGWINIYRDKKSGVVYTENEIWEGAVRPIIKDTEEYIATTKIKWEEEV